MKPKINIKFVNEDLKVLELHGQKGDSLDDHSINISAVLCIIKGEVQYNEAELGLSLYKGEYKLIPKNVVHSITFRQDSIAELITFSKSKIKFVRS